MRVNHDSMLLVVYPCSSGACNLALKALTSLSSSCWASLTVSVLDELDEESPELPSFILRLS